jgi:hypothetical protein
MTKMTKLSDTPFYSDPTVRGIYNPYKTKVTLIGDIDDNATNAVAWCVEHLKSDTWAITFAFAAPDCKYEFTFKDIKDAEWFALKWVK